MKLVFTQLKLNFSRVLPRKKAEGLDFWIIIRTWWDASGLVLWNTIKHMAVKQEVPNKSKLQTLYKPIFYFNFGGKCDFGSEGTIYVSSKYL